MKIKVSTLKDLVEVVNFFVNGSGVHNLYDIIVLEGSECVGKTTLIDYLNKKFDWCTYRPDYNFWSDTRLPKDFRWAIFMSLIDFSISGGVMITSPILVDRGMLSGLIYNFKDDEREKFLRIYEDRLRKTDLRVLHIFLTPTNEDTHRKMIESRVLEPTESGVSEIVEIDRKFKSLVEMSETLDIITYEVKLNDEIDDKYCTSCGHCFSGICQNINSPYFDKVVTTNLRCEHTYDKEVQDYDV